MSRINFLRCMLGYKFYIGIAIVIAGLFMTWHVIEVNKLKQKVTEEVTLKITSEYNRKLIRNQEQVISTNIELQKANDANTAKLQQNLQTATIKYNILVSSLRERPNRPSTDNIKSSTYATSNPESKTGATGAELYRPDAEFLARYASITEELKLNLISCYSNYDSAKEKLEHYANKIKE